MKTYSCTSCQGSIVVGHPQGVFRRQARALARMTHPLLERLLHQGRILGKFLGAMEEKFYLEPHRFRALPSACPRCGFRGTEAQRWWKAGVVEAE